MKLEDRVVYIIEHNEDGLSDLRIKRLENTPDLYVDIENEVIATLEQKAEMVERGLCDIEDLGDDFFDWWTFSEDELWDAFIFYCAAWDKQGDQLKRFAERLAKFKADGKFDGEEE